MPQATGRHWRNAAGRPRRSGYSRAFPSGYDEQAARRLFQRAEWEHIMNMRCRTAIFASPRRRGDHGRRRGEAANVRRARSSPGQALGGSLRGASRPAIPGGDSLDGSPDEPPRLACPAARQRPSLGAVPGPRDHAARVPVGPVRGQHRGQPVVRRARQAGDIPAARDVRDRLDRALRADRFRAGAGLRRVGRALPVAGDPRLRAPRASSRPGCRPRCWRA